MSVRRISSVWVCVLCGLGMETQASFFQTSCLTEFPTSRTTAVWDCCNVRQKGVLLAALVDVLLYQWCLPCTHLKIEERFEIFVLLVFLFLKLVIEWRGGRFNKKSLHPFYLPHSLKSAFSFLFLKKSIVFTDITSLYCIFFLWPQLLS